MAQVQRKKMLWYYSAIIDWMVANPGRPLKECAEHVGRTQATLSVIINSDMFKAALAQRKASFQTHHDLGLIEKTTRVASAGLDAILDTLDKRRDKIPLADLNAVTDGALQRLGYGVKPQPGVQVNVQNNGGTANVVVPVSAQDLAEARMALRQVQQQSRSLPAARPDAQLEAPQGSEAQRVGAKESELVTIEGEVNSAPTSPND